MNKPIIYFVLLLICVVSRLITSINFVEDPQSLAISLQVNDPNLIHVFNTINGPLFCLLIKFISTITNNYSVSFSIVGGIATFVLIYYVLKLLKVPITSLEGGFTVCLLFFNPLLWIAGNRYTPDLSSNALVIASFYYLLADNGKKYSHHLGWLLAGIAGGFSLLYLPFLFIPLIYTALFRKQIYISIGLLLLGLSSWLLPSILLHDWLYVQAQLKETIFASNAQSLYTWKRLGEVFENIWAGGLGGYWWGRSLFTILFSFALIPCLFFGTMILLSFDYPRRKIFTVWGAGLLFIIWLYVCPLSSNIQVITLMPFLVILISYGIIYFLVNFNMLAVKAAILLFLIFNIWIGIYFAREHQYPNAAEQLRTHISQSGKQAARIFADADLCNFLNTQNENYHCTIAVPPEDGIVRCYKEDVNSPSNKAHPRSVYYFYNNPYINSWFSAIELREY